MLDEEKLSTPPNESNQNCQINGPKPSTISSINGIDQKKNFRKKKKGHSNFGKKCLRCGGNEIGILGALMRRRTKSEEINNSSAEHQKEGVSSKALYILGDSYHLITLFSFSISCLTCVCTWPKRRLSSPHRRPSPAVPAIASTLPYDDSSTDETSSIQQYRRSEISELDRANNASGQVGKDPVITINVSGMKFQTYESTLRRFPNSILGDPLKRRKLWNEQLQEVFLDRSRACFESILHIYRSGGQVIRPMTVPVELFIEELLFYGLRDDVWANFCESEGCRIIKAEKEPENPLQRKIWHLIEHPDTSPFARLLATISVAVIIISTVSFCLESIPDLKPMDDQSREWSSPFFWIEFSCCLWFSIELLIRFIVSPSKTEFMKSFLNVLDFVAVAPFFINLMFQDDNKNSSSTSFAVLRIVRLVRVFRIFKLSRHFTGLQVLGKTFRASIQEFFLLIFFMGIALVLFSSGVYFAEQGEQNTKFTSIPASFWYVLATMTTVGYGDLVPHGVYGKIVGSCCALIGVLTLALPVPIIVANFKRFYRQEIILAKMYEQNPQPKEAQAMLKYAKEIEQGMSDPIMDGNAMRKKQAAGGDELV